MGRREGPLPKRPVFSCMGGGAQKQGGVCSISTATSPEKAQAKPGLLKADADVTSLPLRPPAARDGATVPCRHCGIEWPWAGTERYEMDTPAGGRGADDWIKLTCKSQLWDPHPCPSVCPSKTRPHPHPPQIGSRGQWPGPTHGHMGGPGAGHR